MEVLHVPVSPDGQFTIPETLREDLGVGNGGSVAVEARGGGMLVRRAGPSDDVIRRIQDRVRKLVPEGVSLAEELIAERRAEAARDALD